MTERALEELARDRMILSVQHPAIQMILIRVTPGFEEHLPRVAGIYCLIALALQRSYIGTSEDLGGRIADSLKSNLVGASHVLIVIPLGVPWTDKQRLALEAALISVVPGAQNKSAGRSTLPTSVYLESIVEQVRRMTDLLLFATAAVGRDVPTQGSIARDLVLHETRHPMSVAQLLDRLRALGWPIQGSTTHRTLRRDLCQGSRGGSKSIKVTGPWTVPSTLVYVQGRRYASGWSESR